jgi:hypothetical protein
VKLAVLVATHEAGTGGDAFFEHMPDGINSDDLLRLLVGEAHVEEALTAQSVQEEAILGHRQQDCHRVRQVRLHPHAEHDILQVVTIQ